MDDQTLISEDIPAPATISTVLQVLLSVRGVLDISSDNTRPSSADQATLLDSLALFLSSATSDVTAVALDGKTTLFVAKNHKFGPNPKVVYSSLLQVLLSDKTEPRPTIPITRWLLMNCTELVRSRLKKFQDALTHPGVRDEVKKQVEIFESRLPGLEPSAEHQAIAAIFQSKGYNGAADMLRLIDDITKTTSDVIALVGKPKSPIITPTDDMLDQFTRLAAMCHAFARCHFTSWIATSPALSNLQRIIRRCLKIDQFYIAPTRFIKLREKKESFLQNLKIVVLDPPPPSQFSHTKTLAEALKTLGFSKAPTDAQERNWRQSATASAHAELQIIRHFHLKGLPVSYIGCNKRSCWCCAAYMDSFNAEFNTHWRTRASHGKPYSGWRLPPAKEGEKDFERLRNVNGRFWGKLKAQAISLLRDFHHRPSPSDSRYSGSISSDEEMAKELETRVQDDW
jgi:hypothetical protein